MPPEPYEMNPEPPARLSPETAYHVFLFANRKRSVPLADNLSYAGLSLTLLGIAYLLAEKSPDPVVMIIAGASLILVSAVAYYVNTFIQWRQFRKNERQFNDYAEDLERWSAE